MLNTTCLFNEVFNRKIWIIRFDYSIVLVILFFQSSIVFIKSSLLMNKLKWDVFWLNSLNKKLSFDELNVSNFYGYCTHSPFQLLAVTKRAACCFYFYVRTKWICIRAYSHCMVNNIIYSHSSKFVLARYNNHILFAFIELMRLRVRFACVQQLRVTRDNCHCDDIASSSSSRFAVAMAFISFVVVDVRSSRHC